MHLGEIAADTYQVREMRIKIEDIQIWFVIGAIVISIFLFWAGALAYAYVADDLTPTPADERSMPPPKSY
jgi:hypothetical protein